MRAPVIFEPARGLGIVFHIFALLLLVGASVWGIWQAARSAISPSFLLYLLPLLVAFALVPLLAYRLYSLLGAYYHLERDGLRLRWGLRIEDIPTNDVVWISPDSELDRKLPLPFLRWPGSVLGLRITADGKRVEFMAGQSRRLIVLATEKEIYAISPAQPEIFLGMFRGFMELGSLSPLTPRSIHPSFLLTRVWRHRPARYLILTGLVLNLLLLVWVSLVIPERTQIYLSFSAGSEPVPSIRLLLIPVFSSFFYLVNAFLGLFFFRRIEGPPLEVQMPLEDDFREPIEPEPHAGSLGSRLGRIFWDLRDELQLVPQPYLAHLLWGSSVLVSALFILATYYILGNSG